MNKDERHQKRMVKKKEIIDRKIAAARDERGVLLVNTGNGKGKSSAAFGLVARALGHGLKVAVVQFVKGRSDTGEEAFFRTVPGVSWHVCGEGFTWETQDDGRDKAAAAAAWQIVLQHLNNPDIGLVVLDEFTYALKYRWLETEPVLAAFAARPTHQHLVVTGRGAPPELLALADTATEMGMVKHAFQAGLKAMPGMEW
ncbi:cob(I)yrinic acid a,c-diamide adenosyltransferase [Azovibrio restrictus]|uniref:cob(I)yrinic acid a,c-diamide adenosyltransferase n=1 Tax=Azovibrio restrictus TaxID=146938 RepID=UPI0026EE1DD6|nr:cob(I)yrinic acid a,c-diamide adenosyltransferase [Azovibrio restrictus]